MDRGGGLIGAWRRLVGIGGFLLAAVVTVFHGRLLWQRLIDGSLLQPIVVARWALSALLVVALLRLWSKGLPILRGRRAGVVWMVVVLLHAFAPGGSLPAVGPVADGMLPAALALLTFLAIGLVGARAADVGATRRATPRSQPRPGRSFAGWYRVLFSRPPPASLHP